MANCILRSYDARNALKHGKEMTTVQKIIMLASDPFAHSEFQFSIRHRGYGTSGISHSATMQGDGEGSRFLDIDYTIHPERWVNLVLPMTDKQEDKGYARAWEINGMPYDTVGVTSLATRWNIVKPNPDALWCSEDVAEIIKAAYEYGEEFKPDTFAPLGLFIEMYRRIGLTNTPS